MVTHGREKVEMLSGLESAASSQGSACLTPGHEHCVNKNASILNTVLSK